MCEQRYSQCRRCATQGVVQRPNCYKYIMYCEFVNAAQQQPCAQGVFPAIAPEGMSPNCARCLKPGEALAWTCLRPFQRKSAPTEQKPQEGRHAVGKTDERRDGKKQDVENESNRKSNENPEDEKCPECGVVCKKRESFDVVECLYGVRS